MRGSGYNALALTAKHSLRKSRQPTGAAKQEKTIPLCALFLDKSELEYTSHRQPFSGYETRNATPADECM